MQIVPNLASDKLRSHVVSVMATCVHRVRRFSAVGSALLKHGVGSSNNTVRLHAVTVLPQLITPVVAESVDYRNVMVSARHHCRV